MLWTLQMVSSALKPYEDLLENFTEVELLELREAFVEHDRDGSGCVTFRLAGSLWHVALWLASECRVGFSLRCAECRCGCNSSPVVCGITRILSVLALLGRASGAADWTQPLCRQLLFSVPLLWYTHHHEQ